MLVLSHHFTGTYAKNALADWTVIADIIQKKTRWIKETIQSHQTSLSVSPALSDQQMDDAFNGPFQSFFKLHLTAYANIAKMNTALTLVKEDYFKETEHLNEKVFAIPGALLEKTEFSTLKKIRDELDAATKLHDTQWETEIKNWITWLLDFLQKNNIQLSDLELQEFSMNQPLSELHDRFIDLKLNLPKLSKSDFNFQQYFTVKIMLAIQSALNRTQQPHTEKDIEQQLKLLGPILKKIDKTEKALLQTQTQAVTQLVANIIF